MANDDLPCGKNLIRGKCPGVLVVVDTVLRDGKNSIRLRCSKCGRVTYFELTLKEFYQLLEDRERKYGKK